MKKPFKTVLTASLQDEQKALDERFEKADSVLLNPLEKKEPISPPSKVKSCTFSIPETEIVALENLFSRALKLGCRTNKSELLKAGIQTLGRMDDAQLESTISRVEKKGVGRRGTYHVINV